MGKAAGVKKKEPAHGYAGDRYVVEIRGRSYYVIDAKTSGIVGGPYREREAAQSRADQLQSTLARR